ncbi:MAG: ankyrin repeat domain-containing protein [Spirochaeta sp.]|nr:ankyrin repeat domain-containing protein [Spirochaeta sp.]
MDIRMTSLTRLCTAAMFLFLLPLGADGQDLTEQLHLAARAADTNAIQSSLELGAAVDARDAYNWTALMLVAAANVGAPEQTEQAQQQELAAKTLIDAGADVNARSIDGWSPLHFAAALSNNPAMVETLLAAGAAIEARTMESWSAEMTLARYTGEQRVQQSIGMGAEADGNIGYTPLMAAAKFGTAELVRALMLAGADPTAQDEQSRTACDYGHERDAPSDTGISELLCRDQ